jgi:CobQ-like glutamine amidotransferase family enzyme
MHSASISKVTSLSDEPIYVTHLYAKEMSIYGDMGNILALSYRLEKLGWSIIYQPTTIGQTLPEKTDFYFMGGGQDKEQELIFQDLLGLKDRLLEDLEKGVPMLAICGAYQLLGQKFLTGSGVVIDGLGYLEVETKAPDNSVKSRCIGNIVEECLLPELEGVCLVGFENHGGQTYFTSQEKCRPLAKVKRGFGNNRLEKIEGCVRKNTVGTYLHGSCLPKNPELADWFIQKILEVKFTGQKIELDWSKLKISDEVVIALRQKLIQMT